MRPVARVRLNTGSRSAAGASGANAAALRARFEQLLQGGAGVPAVRQTESLHDARSSTSARSAGLDVLMAGREVAAWPDVELLHQAEDTVTAATTATKQVTAATKPLASPALTVKPIEPGDRRATTTFDALQPERVAEAATARKPDSSDAQITPAELRAPDRSVAHLQPNQQPPTPQRTKADSGQKDLPELVRELVQAVVHLARGREGQWRLTMALKPQVLEGTLVELSAQPGSLQVRFDCAGTQACERLTAARTDLHQRLTEALSAARPVDVRVEVRATTQVHAHGHA
jgi:hypothetical protein